MGEVSANRVVRAGGDGVVGPVVVGSLLGLARISL